MSPFIFIRRPQRCLSLPAARRQCHVHRRYMAHARHMYIHSACTAHAHTWHMHGTYTYMAHARHMHIHGACTAHTHTWRMHGTLVQHNRRAEYMCVHVCACTSRFSCSYSKDTPRNLADRGLNPGIPPLYAQLAAITGRYATAGV